MSRDLYGIVEFKDGHLPSYRCPYCNSVLKGIPESAWDATSKYLDSVNPGFDQEDVVMYFRMDLKCANSECEQIVFCTGSARYVEDGFHAIRQHTIKYKPLMFVPYLEPFLIPEYAPYAVQECVKASFQLLFVNNGSALNEVRKALERLMDHLGVPENENGKRINLHRRVQLMPAEHQEYGVLINATKILGNSGSHGSEIDREAVLDAYEMMDIVLEGMFNGRRRKAEELAAQINKRKAPLDLVARNLGDI